MQLDPTKTKKTKKRPQSKKKWYHYLI